ncbi:MAG TPA: trigger factor [Paludibacter sp.]|jgi:trigger factor|nr:MAG: Trigger factor [Bacteroidetes bacterium ADurb.Bin174]HQB27386.1 trigger factor [Paludibacter sp.]
MNIVRKDLDPTNANITISIEKSDYEVKVDKTLREYRKKSNVPGFRPGMVPLGLLKKMYGKSILAEEINNILSEGLYNYIKDNNIDLLGEPLPNETEQKEIDFDTQESFEFVFDIALPPAFEVELTKKDKIKYYQITPDEAMIENQVKSYAGRFGKYEQEETVKEEDMLKGLLVELENGEEKADGIRVENAVLTPAYMKEEAIKTIFVGAKKEGEVIFNPKQAYENEAEVASLLKLKKEEVENLTSDFKYTIQSITRYHEAAVNQDLFDKVFGEGVVKSEKEFKEKIKENIAKNLSQDSNYKFGLDAREVLVKKYKDLSFPDAFLKRWLLRTNKDLTEETLETDYPKMREDLTWQLIRNKIVKAHDVKIEKEDVEAYAKQIARSQFAQYGIPNADDQMIEPYVQEMLKNENQLKAIIDRVTENKVVDIIKEAVKLDVKEVSIEEFNKMFEEK